MTVFYKRNVDTLYYDLFCQYFNNTQYWLLWKNVQHTILWCFYEISLNILYVDLFFNILHWLLIVISSTYCTMTFPIFFSTILQVFLYVLWLIILWLFLVDGFSETSMGAVQKVVTVELFKNVTLWNYQGHRKVAFILKSFFLVWSSYHALTVMPGINTSHNNRCIPLD